MTYKINGTALTLQPTTGNWRPRESFGDDGNGHPIYSAYREFEFSWGLASPAEQSQLQTFFDSVITTGTAVIEVPKYGDSTYTFQAYSGCVLREPQQSNYFAEHITNMRLLATQIKL